MEYIWLVTVVLVVLFAIFASASNKKKAVSGVASNSSKDDYYHPMLSVAKRNLQILQESQKIIESTNNIQTLTLRKNDILNMLDIFEDYEIKYPNERFLLINGAHVMRLKFYERFNEIVFRVAKENLEAYRIKTSELVRLDAKKRNTIDMFTKIDQLREIVIIEAKNSEECFSDLNNFHSQVEELFSGLGEKPNKETIKINPKDFDRDKYLKVMPDEISNALQLASLRGAYRNIECYAEVSKELFDKMITDYNNMNELEK